MCSTFTPLCVCVCVCACVSLRVAGEKRKPSDPLSHEDTKRQRVVGDIPLELINEVMATIADPAAIPEVANQGQRDRGAWPRCLFWELRLADQSLVFVFAQTIGRVLNRCSIALDERLTFKWPMC